MSITYLDHAATTPLRDEVADEMNRVAASRLGNASSLHAAGRRARRLLDDARDEVAALVGAEPDEVVFTSGGTEANDLAVCGVAAARPGVVLCSAVEHDAVLEPVRSLGGAMISVDRRGVVRLDDLTDRLAAVVAADQTLSLVSIMTLNNENGVRQPLDDVAALVRAADPSAVVHTDAVQAQAWMDLAPAVASADLVTLTAHKIGGPVGIGALVVRDGTPLRARLRGGGQEMERRGGTPNVVGAVGFARAMSLAAAEQEALARRGRHLRDRFVDGILACVDGVAEPACSDGADRTHLAGGTAQVCFSGVESEALLFLLDEAGVEASAGSACAAGALETSHVLAAMGVPDSLARGALRISVGRTTTEADVDRAIDAVADAVGRLRKARAA